MYPVFESISRGWTLTKSSFRVLKMDKEMMALPLISGVILLAVWLLGGGLLWAIAGSVGLGAALGILFLVYVASYSTVIFFNTALVQMASIRFAGGDPVLKDGFRGAWARKWRILQWGIVAATVGLILNLLEAAARNADNAMVRIIGQVGVWIAGAAWNVATFFVVPVIVFKDLGPGAAIKESLTTWRRAWGESATGAFSTGIIFFLLALPALLVFWLGITAWWPLVVVAAIYLVAIWAISTAVHAILVTALYQYATTGNLPQVVETTLAAPREPVAARRFA